MMTNEISPYQGPKTWDEITHARSQAAERTIQAAAQGIFPPAAEDEDAPRPERPQQSADHGDIRFLAYSILGHPAYFQVFSTLLTLPAQVQLGTEGARCGKVPGELHNGDETVFVYSAPPPVPTFSNPVTHTEIRVDNFGVCRETTTILPGEPDPVPPPPLISFTSHGRYGDVVLATLGNGEWLKLRFAWNAWSVVAQGRVEASA